MNMREMSEIEKVKERKTPIVRIDNSLNKYDNIILFPEKLEKANEMLRRTGVPKQWIIEKTYYA